MPDLGADNHDFFMVAGPEGWVNNTRYYAADFPEAVDEAERLANLNPGKSFYVLATGVVTKAEPKLTTLYL